MRPSLRLLILLIVTLVLRGAGGMAFAMPMSATDDCHQRMAHHAETADCDCHDDHGATCRIQCDHAASPALAPVVIGGSLPAPAVLIPISPRLHWGEAGPPEHPPPIA